MKGSRVLITGKGMSQQEGLVFYHDKHCGVVVLQQPSTSKQLPHHAPKHNYQMYQLRDVQIKVLTKGTLDIAPSQVNMDKLRTRERNAIRDKVILASQTNTDATAEAQKLFDLLSKTMPCQWQGTDIVLLEGAVLIKAPYGQDNVSGKDSNAVKRILKIMSQRK